MNQHGHYQLIETSNEHELLVQANNMIKDGWIPCGGIDRDKGVYRQSMWNPPMPTEIITQMAKATAMKAIKND
jgi:hypothetical protein|tara:strand:- start:37 stop:255 length:219 start_codon:yes stop_codon:yes gene_type:complete